ncbi:hypothetical protein [Streptomyces sp. SYP-A7185]|uniref:hypothetical protein n=1 Tax=Streptomyces sp. SYP-A7185 TaxID=3040076 RepID=UPI0038F764F9
MDMSWVKKGLRCSLMVVEHPNWTSLSDSSTPGALRALLRGTGNKVVGHADLRSANLVVAGIAAASAAAGSGLTFAGIKLKSRFEDRKAQHAKAAATVVEEAAAASDEVEEPDAPGTPRLRAV